MAEPGAARSHRGLVAVVAGLQALMLLFLHLPAGLVVPLSGYVGLNLAGITLTVAGIIAARRGRRLALACPVVSGLFWVAYVSAGAALFDWTA